MTGVGIAGARLAYTDGMKIIFAILISLMFVACNSPESENLKKENADLKTQLEIVTKERDALKVQMDSIKAVLENTSGTTSTTPDSSATTPENSSSTSSAPESGNNSDSTTSGDGSSLPSKTPSSDGAGVTITPDTATPSSGDGSTSSTTAPNSGSVSTATSAVELYAKDVLETAKKYNDETQQTPPTDCSSGYTAGTHAVPSSDAIASCRVDRVDKGFRITLKDANGAVTTLSDAVAKP